MEKSLALIPEPCPVLEASRRDAAVKIPVTPASGLLGHDFQLRRNLPVLHSGSGQ
jgi:hypothetical protein